MKRLLTTENIIRAIVIIILIAFASIEYNLKFILLALLFVWVLTMFIISTVMLYRAVIDYVKSKQWSLSLYRTILFLCSIVVAPVIVLVFMPTLKIYFFTIIGVILFSLLLFDIARKIFRK
jgi:hypothetical protein